MKKQKLLFCMLIAGLFIASCSNEKSFKVKGKLRNASGDMLYLKELTISDIKTIDSVIVDNDGSFVLKGINNKIAFYSLGTDKKNTLTLVIKPGDKIVVQADAKEIQTEYEVQGSDESQLVKKLNAKLNETLEKINQLGKTFHDSLGSKNIVKIKANLDSAYKIIEADQKNYSINFMRENKGTLASVMALYQQMTPRKSLFTPANDYPTFKEVDSVMMLTYPEADAVLSLHSLISNISEEYVRKMQMEQRLAKGADIPEINLPDFNNQPLALSSLKGKYVLVLFWASWNQKSIDASKSFIGQYWRYKNAGFDVYQVCIDKSRDAWLKAISANGFPWHNVSDLKMWDSPVVALFGIEELPFNIFIDKDGKIVEKQVTSQKLAEKLKEIFKY